MAEERTQRRLAAILAADVVGYSRLMEADETGTLERLNSLRAKLFDPATVQFGGRIFKNTGDGAIAEFPSVVDAVQCATEIQRALAEQNADASDNQKIILRIGISLGDVIVEGEDLYGNGVNIAARLETMADPGGICIAGNVHEQVRTLAGIGFQDLGEQQVKNIERPVRAYRILLDGATAATTALPATRPIPLWRRWPAAAAAAAVLIIGGLAYWQPWPQSGNYLLPKRFSVVVLPFDNLSTDPKQDFFADGITEDLISDLSRIRDAFVIARGTSFTFKGKSVDAKAIAKDLNVRYVLEGSVRRASNQVRVNAQLIDGETGAYIWSDRFDKPLAGIFALQNEITSRIAKTLNVKLIEEESRRLETRQPANVESWEYAFQAWAELVTKRQSRSSTLKAKELLEKALKLDPKSARAWTAMARVHYLGFTSGWGSKSKPESLRLALEAGQRAVEIDPNSADAHMELGYAYLINSRSDPTGAEKARAECQVAARLNPNLDNYRCLLFSMVVTGQHDHALRLFDKWFRLNPYLPNAAVRYFLLGIHSLMAGKDVEALSAANKAIATSPKFPGAYWVQSSALGWLGRTVEAREAFQKLAELDPRRSTLEKIRRHYRHWPNIPRVIEGLRRAGMAEK